jgi:hypothetical protein
MIFGAHLIVYSKDANVGHEVFLMCDDLNAEIADLEAKNVRCSDVEQARWGSLTKIRLPGGGEVGLYEPTHPSPLAPAPND